MSMLVVAPEESSANFEKLYTQYFCKQGFLGISRAVYYRRKKWFKCQIFRAKVLKKLGKKNLLKSED